MHFCRDGILRLRQWVYDPATRSGRTVLLPLDTLCELDSNRFAKQLTYGISFEDGLTVRDLFLNLKPWSFELEGIACMDFAAFVAEVEKPLDPDIDPNLGHIEIHATLQIEADPEFEPDPDPAVEIGRLRTSVLPTPKITDRITFDLGWDYQAFYREPQVERFGPGEADVHVSTARSLDYDPLTRWHHLPIRISDALVVSDETTGLGSDFLSIDAPLLNPDHPWVKAVRSPDGTRLFRHEAILQAPVPTFMTTLVRGFFWNVGFHYTPASRNEAAAAIFDRLDDLDAVLAAGEDPEARIDAVETQILETDTATALDREADWVREQIAYCESRSPDLIRWQD